jgi:F0F1-type ATP synthase assembly protein I
MPEGSQRQPRPQRPPTISPAALLGIGSAFGLCVGIFVFAGVLADRAAGTSPLLALVGVIIGILCGAGGAYQAIRPYTRTFDRDRPDARKG